MCLLSNFQRLVFSARWKFSRTELHTHTQTMSTVCFQGSTHWGIIMFTTWRTNAIPWCFCAKINYLLMEWAWPGQQIGSRWTGTQSKRHLSCIATLPTKPAMSTTVTRSPSFPNLSLILWWKCFTLAAVLGSIFDVRSQSLWFDKCWEAGPSPAGHLKWVC